MGMLELRNLVAAGALVSLLVLSSTAFPAGAAPAVVPRSNSATELFHPVLKRANQLVGLPVRDAWGDKLGTVAELVLDIHDNRVSHILLDPTGLVETDAFGNTIPWTDLRLKRDGSEFLAVPSLGRPVTREPAEVPSPSDYYPASRFPYGGYPNPMNVTPFERYQELNQNNLNPYGANVETVDYGGIDPSREDSTKDPRTRNQTFWRDLKNVQAPENIRTIPFTNLVGMDAVDQSQQDFGEVEDAVIDMHEGRLVFAVLSFGGIPGMDNQITIVPWRSLVIRPDLDMVQVDEPVKMLQKDVYNIDQFPNLDNRAKAEAIYKRFHVAPYWESYGYLRTHVIPRRTRVAWSAKSHYNKIYNPNSLVTIHGTVRSVGSFRPSKEAVRGLRLRVHTEHGKAVTVYAGPRSFLRREGVHFRYGDNVTIIGSKATVRKRSVLLAGEIKKGHQTLYLRDSEGRPLWPSAAPKK